MTQFIVCNLEEIVEAKLRRYGLGTRIAARFAKDGLTRDLPELRNQTAKPADFSVPVFDPSNAQ